MAEIKNFPTDTEIEEMCFVHSLGRTAFINESYRETNLIKKEAQQSFYDGATWVRDMQIENYRGWNKKKIQGYGLVCIILGALAGAGVLIFIQQLLANA